MSVVAAAAAGSAAASQALQNGQATSVTFNERLAGAASEEEQPPEVVLRFVSRQISEPTVPLFCNFPSAACETSHPTGALRSAHVTLRVESSRSQLLAQWAGERVKGAAPAAHQPHQQQQRGVRIELGQGSGSLSVYLPRALHQVFELIATLEPVESALLLHIEIVERQPEGQTPYAERLFTEMCSHGVDEFNARVVCVL